MAAKEHFISKLSFDAKGEYIQDVFAYEYDGTVLEPLDNKVRSWLVFRKTEGSTVSSLFKNEAGEWVRGDVFRYENNLFTWGRALPKNIAKHKVFVSYYHFDDQYYRDRFEQLFGDLIVSKSVNDGDIDAQNSHDYVKKLIQNEYLHDTTLIIVLVGPKTKCRMHVDWEISGALNYKVGDRHAALLALKLPAHPDYGTGSHTYDLLPGRLADNLRAGYARIDDWTEDRVKMQNLIEEAFARRDNDQLITNGRLQMTANTCD